MGSGKKQRPAWLEPEATIAGAVAAEFLLVRTQDVALGVAGIAAYPTGFAFTVVVILREGRPNGPAVEWTANYVPELGPGEPLPDELLRLAVRFADGRRASTVDRRDFGPSDPEPDRPLLSPGGGSGSSRRSDMTYWVWPLPPAGPVTFECEWPGFGIALSRADLDGQLLLDAAARSIRLWPEQWPESVEFERPEPEPGSFLAGLRIPEP